MRRRSIDLVRIQGDRCRPAENDFVRRLWRQIEWKVGTKEARIGRMGGVDKAQ